MNQALPMALDSVGGRADRVIVPGYDRDLTEPVIDAWDGRGTATAGAR